MLSQRARDATLKFVELIDEYETKLLQPLTDFASTVEELLLQIDYFQDLRRGCKTPEESLNREENVREVIRAISEYQARSTEGLSGFLAETASGSGTGRRAGKDCRRSNPDHLSCRKGTRVHPGVLDRLGGRSSAAQPIKARG